MTEEMKENNEWVYVVLDPRTEPLILGVYDSIEGASYGAHIAHDHDDPEEGDEVRIYRARLKSTFTAKKDLLNHIEGSKAIAELTVVEPIIPPEDVA